MTISKPSTKVESAGHRSDGDWLQMTAGERFRIRVSAEETAGAYFVAEMIADPGNGVRTHIHKREDEHFLVLEGMLHIANGDERFDAPVGSVVTVSKGVPHAWCNLSDVPLRMLIVFSPGYVEGMFREVAARKSDDIAAILDKFGCVIVGPPLLDGLHTITSPRI